MLGTFGFASLPATPVAKSWAQDLRPSLRVLSLRRWLGGPGSAAPPPPLSLRTKS